MLTNVKVVDPYFGENDVVYTGNVPSNKPGLCKVCMQPIKYGYMCKTCQQYEKESDQEAAE